MGIDLTHLALTKESYWPRMHCDVSVYVNSCTTCQQYKASNELPAGLARPLPIQDRPFQVWGLDFIIMPASKLVIIVWLCLSVISLKWYIL